MDAVFKALADPNRRALLDQLHFQNGQTLNQLCRHLRMTRQGITKHLGLLIKADLVVPLWRGREKLHYLNPAPLKQISERWIDKHNAACLRALTDLTKGLNKLAGSTRSWEIFASLLLPDSIRIYRARSATAGFRENRNLDRHLAIAHSGRG